MYMGRNRRLANVKTRHETGLDYITQKLNIETPFGKKVLKDNKPFFPGEEEELREELNRVEALVEYVKNNKRTIELLSEVFMEVKDASRTAASIGFCALQGSEEFIAQMRKAQAEYKELTGQTTGVSAVSKQPSARIYRIDGTPADENASGVVIEKGVKRMRNEK